MISLAARIKAHEQPLVKQHAYQILAEFANARSRFDLQALRDLNANLLKITGWEH